jgi:hypothetical protein
MSYGLSRLPNSN